MAMKMTLSRCLIAAVVVLCSVPLMAQQAAPQTGVLCETVAAAVPTMATTVGPSSSCSSGAVDAHIRQITVFVPASTVVTVTLKDAQGSPIQFGGLVTTSSATGTTYIWAWPVGSEYYAKGGFTIQASGSGATFQARWIQ